MLSLLLCSTLKRMTKTTVSDDVINAIRGLIGNPYIPFENEAIHFVLQTFLQRVVQIPGSLFIHWNVIIFTGWSLPNLHKYILSPYICQNDFYYRSKKKSKLFFSCSWYRSYWMSSIQFVCIHNKVVTTTNLILK